MTTTAEMHIDTSKEDRTHESIVSPVSPMEMLDDVESKIAKALREIEERPKPIILEYSEMPRKERENEANAFLESCFSLYGAALRKRETSHQTDPWLRLKSGYVQELVVRKKVKCISEGAIAAGKTTLARKIQTILSEKNKYVDDESKIYVIANEEIVPPGWLTTYYIKRSQMDPEHPVHIKEAAMIQSYVMAHRLKQFSIPITQADHRTLVIQDRLFGDAHFMAGNIRDGIVTRAEVEAYIPLWETVLSALDPPDFVLVLDPLPETVVLNNKTRMFNLSMTANKILACLTSGDIDDPGVKNANIAVACKKFPDFAKTCAPEWSEMIAAAVKLRNRNGESALDCSWLMKHAEEYSRTMDMAEKFLGDIIQFVRIKYEAPNFPDTMEILGKVRVLRNWL